MDWQSSRYTAERMQLYAITDRKLFFSRAALLDQAAAWAAGHVDYVQIREKDLDGDALADLAAAVVQAVRKAGGRTRVLLNGPVELALAAGCDGAHLPSRMPEAAISAAKARVDVVSVSCHTVAEIETARNLGATLALFAPVFEKKIGENVVPGQGLGALSAACKAGSPMPVLALGGVTSENARECARAGAAGVAAIRLFMGKGWMGL